MFSKKKFLLFAFYLAWTCTIAQVSTFSPLLQKLKQLPANHYQEKLFIHIDRNCYLTGETLWLKVYLVNSADHKLTDVSKVAYVEILDKDGGPVIQTKIELANGTGTGNLFIPASLSSGNYLIRGYTAWMKNFSPDFFYSQSVTLINPFKKIEKGETVKLGLPDVQFFPEGGHLVAGLENTIAVRVVSTNGKGSDFKGVILNQTQDSLVKFDAFKFGMGRFSLTPKKGEEYTARVLVGSNWQTVEFPEVEADGIALRADDAGSSLTVKIQSTAEAKNPHLLLVHCRGQMKASEIVDLTRKESTIHIPKDSLGDGINHITLFDPGLKPLCERVYFKRPKNTLNISGSLSLDETGTRKKLELNISLNEKESRTSGAQLSIGIAMEDSLGRFPLQSIDQYLLLSSDLKGTVESPEYYFANTGAEADQGLDLVMLTHGWSRFSWDQIITDAQINYPFVPEYRGHIIRGSVADAAGNPVARIPTYLASPGKNVRMYPSVSNTSGGVFFEMKHFYGPRKVILQTNFEKDSTYTFKIHSPFSDQKPQLSIPEFDLSPAVAGNLLSRSVAMQAGSVFWNINSTAGKCKDSAAFYGQPDERYFLDDYTRFPVLEEVLREYVTGVWVRKRAKNFSFAIPDKVNKELMDGNPLVLLDGVPVFSINQLMEVDPLNVRAIEVVEKKYYLNGTIWDGIASFKTYQGDLGGYKLNPKSLIIDYEGLQVKKEFYMPKYDTPAQIESRIPDRRTLLFWKPDVAINEDGKAKIEFYTSDMKGIYLIRIQGISTDGTPGSAQLAFEVK